MRSGTLRDRITIQRAVAYLGQWGQESTWNDVATVWTSVKASNGAEAFADRGVNGSTTSVVRLRYRSDLTSKDRFIRYGVVLDLVAVTDPDGGGSWNACASSTVMAKQPPDLGSIKNTMARDTFKLEGGKELEAKLKKLGDKVHRRVTRQAVNAAATPVVRAAKANAPKQSGLLKKSLGKKVAITDIREFAKSIRKDFDAGRSRREAGARLTNLLVSLPLQQLEQAMLRVPAGPSGENAFARLAEHIIHGS